MPETRFAPGAPGIAARWTSGTKTGVGTSLTSESDLWFTLSHGIIDEIYHSLDRACIRDMGMIVTDGEKFFSEEKRNTTSKQTCIEAGAPAYRLVNRCKAGRYEIQKHILADPRRPVLLQETTFTILEGDRDAYHLYVLLAPHLANQGGGNTASVGDYKGIPMLFAQRGGHALALACSAPWLKRSVGFVGSSDGWQDLSAHKKMTWNYTRAEDGNVALTGEIDAKAGEGTFLLALGVGENISQAANHARASLQDGFASARETYVRDWKNWQSALLPLDSGEEQKTRDSYRASTVVMRTHESTKFAGGIIASLAIPWGFSKGDGDLGAYHVAWPRDLAETAGGLLAAGDKKDAHRVLRFLEVTQESDGHWPQNMWLDGCPCWDGVQMDETALPVLFLDLALREGALEASDIKRFWPMVQRAASYLVQHGPSSPMDRWEEDPGYSTFTVAAEIAGLLAAADFAEQNDASGVANYLRETADAWYDSIDRWMYYGNTDWCKRFGVPGYYVRLAPPDAGEGEAADRETISVKNVPRSNAVHLAGKEISPDALALVRFGLRTASDARILNTIKVIDALLRVDTPAGPSWHRYNGDGYGEHEDGTPFDGTGIGRIWPLLTGERGHYELAAGHVAEAKKLLHAIEGLANEGGLIPEQIWDSPDLPQHELYFGRPSGSAMPLVWAHAEYVKLLRSLRDNKVFDLPPQTVKRYLVDRQVSSLALWKFNDKRPTAQTGQKLRIEVLAPAVVHWSSDDWATAQDMNTVPSGMGTHIADLSTADLAEGKKICFTFHWPGPDRWEGSNFVVAVHGR